MHYRREQLLTGAQSANRRRGAARTMSQVRSSSVLSDEDQGDPREPTPEESSSSAEDELVEVEGWTDASDQGDYMPFDDEADSVIDVVGDEDESIDVSPDVCVLTEH